MKIGKIIVEADKMKINRKKGAEIEIDYVDLLRMCSVAYTMFNDKLTKAKSVGFAYQNRQNCHETVGIVVRR